MLKRKIMNTLIEWKNNNTTKKKALVIKGLRQIGKTYIVKQFAKEYYCNYIYINFKNSDDLKSVFEENLNVDRILMDLSAKMPNIKLDPYKTLIIFDEIQECANARASLKSFVEDGRYDVIATGSLLGIKGYNKKKGKGVPTGSEHIIYMQPLDFEEFLWAKGISNDIIQYLKDSLHNMTPISKAIHESIIRYFKEYICVGGLPEAVNTFLNTGDMNRVYEEQRDILEEYKDDFGKHLDSNENEEIDYLLLARIEEVFDSIPSQLAKENKKFQYSKIKTKGRSSEYREAIQWLVDAGIVSQCFNLHNLETPLEGNKMDNVFKLYMRDSGLFISMLEKGTAGEILSGNLGVYKGAIFENIIADAFSKKGKKLYYFHKDSGLEIDFITKYNGEVTLIEVKSTTGYTKSAMEVLSNKDKYNVKKCIKFGEYNIGQNGLITTLPYYMAFLLDE
ncbi:MAG: ATP-binding protein [Bacilli bacterium]